jgi:beta-glucosidase
VSGRYNPSGRLPVSWPVDVGQIPIFYARRPSGRPADPEVHYSSKYLDLPVNPLFPFGHGLSYSRFVPRDLRVSATELSPGQALSVEVEVSNQGPRSGEVTIFMFIRDPVASVSRPVLELRDISKALLESGASTTLSFRLTVDDLRFLGPDLSPRLEPGLVELFVGPSANPADLLRAEIRLVVAS